MTGAVNFKVYAVDEKEFESLVVSDYTVLASSDSCRLPLRTHGT